MPSARNSPRSSAILSGSRLSDAAGIAIRTVRGTGEAAAGAAGALALAVGDAPADNAPAPARGAALARGRASPAPAGAAGRAAGAHAAPHRVTIVTSASKRCIRVSPHGEAGTAVAAATGQRQAQGPWPSITEGTAACVEAAAEGSRHEIRPHEPHLAQARHGAGRAVRAALARAS